MAKSFLNYFRL